MSAVPYSIKECLHGYTNDALGMVCAAWELATSSKPNRMRAVERILRDPLHVTSAMGGLAPEALRALHLAAGRGAVSLVDLLGVPGLYSRGKSRETIEELLRLGFLLVTPQTRSGAFSFALVRRAYHPADEAPLLFVPETVRAQMPPCPPFPYSLAPVTEVDVAADAPRPDRATFVFLETLRIVEVLTPRITAANALHKTDEARAFELARDAELPQEAFSLGLMIARETGCVAAKGGRLQTTPQAGEWARLGRADRTQALFTGYLAAPAIPDLTLFFHEMTQRLEEHLPLESIRRTYHRQLVAEILRNAEPATWYAVEDVNHLVRRIDPNILFLDERWRALHQQVADVSQAWKDRNWLAHERRLFVWTVRVLMADLGMVELGGEGKFFRLTPVGRYALGVGPAPDEQDPLPQQSLVVQPDFEVIAYLDRCPPDLRRKLDTCCERVRGGMVATYRLTQESFYRALQSGLAADDIYQMFESHSVRALPSNVQEQFQTWARKLESISIYRDCILIECETPADADAAAAEWAGSRRFGERFVLADTVPEGTARIDYSDHRRPILEERDGLTFRVPWEHADLFARKRLAELGELSRNGTGEWSLALTQAHARKSGDWSLAAADLEALLGRPLPVRYRVALQAWSGDIEPASSHTATLVRFPDVDICEAVMDMAGLRDDVEGRIGLYTLVIRQGALAGFKRKLKAHGIPCQAGGPVADSEPPEAWATAWVAARESAAPASGEALSPSPRRTERRRSIPVNESLPSYSPRIIAEILEDAIARRRPVLIEYQNAWSERPSVRRVDPVSVDFSSAAPHVSGYCHVQQGARVFRLSQIAGIRVLEDESY